MAWENNLREAAYTSPSGTRLTFLYESTSEEFNQKGGRFDFANANGTFVQSLGVSGRRYPLRIIVSGNDYDEQAADWMDALSERGEGRLEHPVYGLKVVVPSGRIRRTDSLVDQCGQAIIDVTLFETIGAIYPTSDADPVTTVNMAVEEALLSQAQQLEESGVVDTVAEEQSFLDSVKDNLDFVYDSVGNSLNAINDVVDTASSPVTESVGQVQRAQRMMNNIHRSINNAIDKLIGSPISLATQVQQLIKTPSRIIASANSNIEAYNGLFKQVTGSRTRAGQNLASTPPTSTPPPFETPLPDSGAPDKPNVTIGENNADFQSRDLMAGAIAVIAAEAAVNVEFASQSDAITAAEQLLQMLDELAVFRDESYQRLGMIDDGAAWQAAENAMSLAAGTLIDASFGLARERSVVVTHPTTIINVSARIFGSVDDRLDEIINNNNLVGDELLELPVGKEIVYFEQSRSS